MPTAHLPPTPHRQTTLIGLFLLLLVGLFTWQSWRTDRDDQLQQLRTVAELAERATDRYFTQQQLALGELAGRLVDEGGLGDPGRAHRLLLAKYRFDFDIYRILDWFRSLVGTAK